MKTLLRLDKKERSLLLYLEARAVDAGGVVDMQRMNLEEIEIAQRWKEEGFLTEWRRVPFDAITQRGQSQLVELSENAWQLAHEERRARAMRMREEDHVQAKWQAGYRS